jgi:hypothetical protein
MIYTPSVLIKSSRCKWMRYVFGEADMELTIFRECGGTIECEISMALHIGGSTEAAVAVRVML